MAAWRKSSYSGTQENACVELTDLGAAVGIRDSKQPEGGHLALSRTAFARLVEQIKRA